MEIIPGLSSRKTSGSICMEDGFEVTVDQESIQRAPKSHLCAVRLAIRALSHNSRQSHCISGKSPAVTICGMRAPASPHNMRIEVQWGLLCTTPPGVLDQYCACAGGGTDLTMSLQKPLVRQEKTKLLFLPTDQHVSALQWSIFGLLIGSPVEM